MRNRWEYFIEVEMIMQIGEGLHPEQPYASPKVTLIVDDARSYFKKNQKKYELIVYGLLDSHTLFSNMSSLRLDNFVYTVEGIQEARQPVLNKPDTKCRPPAGPEGSLPCETVSGLEWKRRKTSSW